MSRILERFKKYFIPHEGNEHQPHFLREGTVVAVLVLIVLIEAAVVVPSFFIFPHSQFLASVLPEALTNLTNENRLTAQLPPLKNNSLLARAAQLKAEDMASRGYFSHQSPEGWSPWVWLDRVGYRFVYAGENLAVNFFDSQDVTRAWMASPSHKSNIVRADFTEIGIGVAPGRFQGRDSFYVVQFFGQPRESALGLSVPVETEGELLLAGVNQLSDTEEQEEQIVLEETEIPRLNRVLGAAVAAANPSYWELTSLRLHTLSTRIYLILLALAVIAFILNLFVKIRIQHPHIITNGLILILVIFAILFINDQLFVSRMQTSNLDTVTQEVNN